MTSSTRTQFALGGLLVALTALAYWPSLGGGFIWDDHVGILKNPLLHASDGLWKIWFTNESAEYFPLTYSVFWFAVHAFGDGALGYRLLNLSIHCGNALLLWMLLRKMGFRYGYLAALLFAVHPVNVDSVAWIFQLRTTLSSGLGWLSCLLWLWYIEKAKSRFYAGSLLSFALSALAKLMAVTTPVVMLAFAKIKTGRYRIFTLLPFFAAAAVFGLGGVFYHSPESDLFHGYLRADTLLGRALGASHSFWFYLLKTAVPVNLMFVYPFWRHSAENAISYLPCLALLAVGVYFFWRGRRDGIGLALGYSFVVIFPALGLANIYLIGFSWKADHWNYMAIIGNIVALLLLIERIDKRAVTAVAMLAVAAFTFLTFQRAHLYHDEEALWRDTIQRNPLAESAYENLGIICMDRGDYGEALKNFERVVALDLEAFQVLNNIGSIYVKTGHPDLAIPYYEASVKITPQSYAPSNLALTLFNMGDLRRAEPYYVLAADYGPPDRKVENLNQLGQFYLADKQPQKAAEAFKRTLQIQPGDATARAGLEKALRGL